MASEYTSDPRRPGGLRRKTYNPLVWVIDPDLQVSAESLSKKYLDKTISGLCAVLLNARLYAVKGIRNKRGLDYALSSPQKIEFLESVATGLSTASFTPTLIQPGHRVTKWARKCQENYQYFKDYLEKCMIEWNARGYPEHGKDELAALLLSCPNPRRLPFSRRPVALEWKVLPPKFRQKDVIGGMRKYYCSRIKDPLAEYADCARGVPPFFNTTYVV